MLAKKEHLWEQIKSCQEATQDESLLAALAFYESLNNKAPSFLVMEDDIWFVVSSDGGKRKLGNDEFTFKVGDSLILENEEVRNYWKDKFNQERNKHLDEGSKDESTFGMCLVTGLYAPIARTHNPKIQGVPETQGSGAKVVSFEKSSPSFSSFGFKQSFNSPISEDAATAYCVALNKLLNDANTHFRIGQTSVCFWAKETRQASSRIAQMFNRPDPASIKTFLAAPWAGLDRELVKRDRFYSVTLSGNAGRIVVRHWLHITLEQAFENFKRWFDDLEITPYGDPSVYEDQKRRAKDKESMPPLALFRLACSTVRDSKDLQAETLTQLYRAALEGSVPSVMLLKPMLYRLQVDLPKHGLGLLANPSRFALIRLIVNRNQKDENLMIKPQVFETSDPAYNCGRLLAIFDSLQRSAHGAGFDGATVSERYFSAAVTTPNTAFSLLWKLHTHHLKKLRQQGEKGKRAANKIKNSINEAAILFQPDKPGDAPQFPRHFNLIEQGRFALGFYQQMAVRKAAIDEYVRRKKTGEIKPEDADDELELLPHA
ncbi:type I-C CRISPR-associated protein Cas8c/Csd1 [Methylomagnum sp.]